MVPNASVAIAEDDQSGHLAPGFYFPTPLEASGGGGVRSGHLAPGFYFPTPLEASGGGGDYSLTGSGDLRESV
ncbi:hypothetical protein LWI29_035516 [Acer saccharum]|uniref:Uncharacterized protein n=1 Tax=Acer saccharum TaxID=4024 RepID=A0AA39T948_ACESA|nr:hypothetical protein LWI29_035516 [Acer saccharum]